MTTLIALVFCFCLVLFFKINSVFMVKPYEGHALFVVKFVPVGSTNIPYVIFTLPLIEEFENHHPF